MDSPLKKIEDELKTAMKARDSFKLGVLRMLKSALKNQEIDLQRAVNEADFIETLTKLVKQRQESIAQYEKAGRADVAESEKQEMQFLQSYLPRPLSDDELTALIQEAAKTVGATGPQDMGKVMAAIKDATRGRVDGKILADKVKQALNKQ